MAKRKRQLSDSPYSIPDTWAERAGMQRDLNPAGAARSSLILPQITANNTNIMAVAAAAGISVQMLSLFLRGSINLKTERLLKIAEFLHIDPELITQKEIMSNAPTTTKEEKTNQDSDKDAEKSDVSDEEKVTSAKQEGAEKKEEDHEPVSEEDHEPETNESVASKSKEEGSELKTTEDKDCEEAPEKSNNEESDSDDNEEEPVVEKVLPEHEEAWLKFGRHVKEYRISKGYTKEQLAKMCGLTTQQLSDVEKARIHPSGIYCMKLAEALDATTFFKIQWPDNTICSFRDAPDEINETKEENGKNKKSDPDKKGKEAISSEITPISGESPNKEEEPEDSKEVDKSVNKTESITEEKNNKEEKPDNNASNKEENDWDPQEEDFRAIFHLCTRKGVREAYRAIWSVLQDPECRKGGR